MNVWHFCALLSINIWGLFFKTQYSLIFITILALYLALCIYFQAKFSNTFQQKSQIASFDEPGDPTLYVTTEIDLTSADNFIKKFNEQNPGEKITYTHFGLASVAHSLKAKNLNEKMCFGAYSKDSGINGSVVVDVNGQNIDVLLVKDADKKGLPEIASFMNQKVKLAKTQQLKQVKMQNKIISFFPSYIAQVIMSIGMFFISDLELKLPPLTPKQTNRVHFAISNVSASNIQHGYTAFPAITKIALICVMSAPSVKPVVVEGKIEPRKTIALNFIFDSRFVSLEQSIYLVPMIKQFWENSDNYSQYVDSQEKAKTNLEE